MMIQPFGSDNERDAPAFWVLEPNYREMSLGQLLQRFYDEFDPDEPLSYKPLGQVFNPVDPKTGNRFYGDAKQVCIFVYRRDFYIVVEKHWRLVEGPHPTRLFYKCYQIPETIWVATLQLDQAMFYNDQILRERLTAALYAKEFYQSDRSAGEIIIL